MSASHYWSVPFCIKFSVRNVVWRKAFCSWSVRCVHGFLLNLLPHGFIWCHLAFADWGGKGQFYSVLTFPVTFLDTLESAQMPACSWFGDGSYWCCNWNLKWAQRGNSVWISVEYVLIASVSLLCCPLSETWTGLEQEQLRSICPCLFSLCTVWKRLFCSCMCTDLGNNTLAFSQVESGLVSVVCLISQRVCLS